MFRLVVQRRTFVSSALLSRTWGKGTVVQLKEEARARGLSVSGTKVALIARLEEYEAAAGTRHSSSSSARATDAPGNPQSPRLAEPFFAVDIPQGIEPNHEPEVQIPYVPEFWGSESVAAGVEPTMSSPKLLVVAGAITHHGGGPSHSFLPEEHTFEPPIAPPPKETPKASAGLLADIADDLGLSKDSKGSLWKWLS